jgi:hypothetical protein
MAYRRGVNFPYPQGFKTVEDAEAYLKQLYRALLDNEYIGEYLSDVTAGVGDHTILDGDVHTDTVGPSTGGAIANGDVLRVAALKWNRLHKESDGQVLTLVDGLPEWDDTQRHNLLDGDIHPDTEHGDVEKGDIIRGGTYYGSTKWQRVPLGISRFVLTSDGGTGMPEWRDTRPIVEPGDSASQNLSGDECWNSIVTNVNAVGDTEYNLPSAELGMRVTLYLVTANKMKLIPTMAGQIMVITDGVGDYLQSDAVVGSYISLVCLVTNQWHRLSYAGVWTKE